MVLWQNIQSGATAKASVVQVGAAGSKGGAGRDEFRSDHFARCQQRNARRICPDILRRGAANGMLQCQRGVRGKKRLCDGTGGWAGVGSTCAEAGRGAFCAAAASITNRAAAKRSRAVSSSQGEVMASTLAPQDISVSNCQSRRSSSARAGPVSPAAAPLTRILPESWAKSRGGQKHHPSHGRARAGGAVGAQRR